MILFIRLLYTAFVLILLISPLQAKDVLVVTWQGKLPSEKSFETRLKELQPKVTFHHIDANRDKTTLARKLRAIDLSGFDLIYSFGTTCSRLVKQFLGGKRPQVFNIVSTPVYSGIADSLEKPGNNLTGAKLLIDTDVQLEYMYSLRKIKTLVAWFDPREKQNSPLLEQTDRMAKKLGIQLKTFRIIPDAPNFEDQLSKASDEANNSDALILLGGSSFHQNARKLHSKLSPSLFVIAGSKYFVLHGATVALAADFEERGMVSANLAHKILSGAKAGEIPVNQVTMKNATLFMNKDKIKSVGIDIPKAESIRLKIINQIK